MPEFEEIYESIKAQAIKTYGDRLSVRFQKYYNNLGEEKGKLDLVEELEKIKNMSDEEFFVFKKTIGL